MGIATMILTIINHEGTNEISKNVWTRFFYYRCCCCCCCYHWRKGQCFVCALFCLCHLLEPEPPAASDR